MIYLRLFYEFLKAGLFAVGGGLATLPFLYEISDKTAWFTHAELTDMIAVSESTPGAIGINAATYVGFTTAGLPGAIAATFGLVFPSIIIIILVARVLQRFKGNKTIKAIFYGLRPASTAMIAAAGYGVFKISLLNLSALQSGNIVAMFRIHNIALALILFFMMKKFPKHPAYYIALSAIAGIILSMT